MALKSEFTWPIKYIKVNYFLVMGMVGDFMERLISAFIVLLMVGCGGGSDGSTDSEVSGINDIVGLWDASEERDEGRDEIYWGISSSGSFSVYDYFGDAFDEGPNCYVIAEGFGRITSLGGNLFNLQINEPEEVSSVDIEVSKAGEDLIIDFLDESGDDPVRLPPSSLSIATIRSMACDVSDISGQAKVSEARPDITKKVLRFLE